MASGTQKTPSAFASVRLRRCRDLCSVASGSCTGLVAFEYLTGSLPPGSLNPTGRIPWMTEICISLLVIVALLHGTASAFAAETLDQQHLPSKNSGSLPCLKRHVKAKAVKAVRVALVQVLASSRVRADLAASGQCSSCSSRPAVEGRRDGGTRPWPGVWDSCRDARRLRLHLTLGLDTMDAALRRLSSQSKPVCECGTKPSGHLACVSPACAGSTAPTSSKGRVVRTAL